MGGLDAAKPVIICGSGPSLTKVPYREPGYPLAAISTAIRAVPEPDYWILVDRARDAHGDAGQAALRNPEVKKVVPGDREKLFEKFPNVEVVRRFSAGAAPDREFMDGKDGVVTAINRSILFAVQVLAREFDTLIFAGVDLKTTKQRSYCHDFEPPEKKRVVSMEKGLKLERDQLRRWAPIAKKHGVHWLSWTPGSPIEEFLEKFEWMSTQSCENCGS